ncbi:hypothetical protein FACS1894109_05930 [Spirochaetia bacterium]|nr:hypothetical protein FACS1894109_05930 [Spirochaetia bacterium]
MMEKRPVKRRAPVYIACFLAILLASCDQSPLFYQISQEIEPKEPRIKGVPSNFVEFNGAVYVGSASLHRYAKNAEGKAVWDEGSIPQPSGRIYALAAINNADPAKSFLYALTESGLYKLGVGQNAWSGKITIEAGDGTAFSSIQTIYAAGNTLFAGGWNGITTSGTNAANYAIFYEDNGVLKLKKANTGLLSGAVVVPGGRYYLATNGAGIYYLSSLNSAVREQSLQDSNGGSESVIVGIIDSGDIIAVTRSGNILKVDTASHIYTAYSTGQRMTGAVAKWYQNSSDTAPKLLLLGIQPGNGSTSTIYGYREIVLDSDGKLQLNSDGKLSLRIPGNEALSSVDNRDRYDNTLGTHPVSHLFQAPSAVDSAMTLFAGIQGTGRGVSNSQKALNSGGVWSYRNEQWNAEE